MPAFVTHNHAIEHDESQNIGYRDRHPLPGHGSRER